MKKVKNAVQYLFREELDIRHKLVNLIMVALFVVEFPTLVITVLVGADLSGVIVQFITLCVISFLIFWVNIREKSEIPLIVFLILCDCLSLPIMYFSYGGIRSGMPIWMLMGLVFCQLLLRGVVSVIMFIVCFLSMASCLLIEYLRPEMVMTHLSGTKYVIDVAQSALFVGIIFATIFKYQSYVYEKQRRYMEAQDAELNETLIRLKAANNAKSDFLANMSHEIRTPINAVLGMDEMILRENEDDQINQYAKNIESAGHTLLSLINDILDFSKIESGKMEIIPVEYDMFSVLNDSYNLIAMKAREKDLTVEIVNNPNLPSLVLGDEVRIRQVISNLLTNAVKYTPAGKVTLNLDFRELYKDTISLIISVTDTGVGISEENQKKLFSAFQRVDEKKNRNIEGTGLGLTITKRIVELMGGKISLESEVGKGSTFTVVVEQKVVSYKPVGKYSDNYKTKSVTKKSYRVRFKAPEARILAVDDVKMNLDVVRSLLKATEVKLDLAYSGREALELCNKNDYNIILMDHMMPEMDGIETMHRIKEMDNPNSSAPIIALTANAIMGVEDEYLAEGFIDYLSKPIRGEDLEAMIFKHLPGKFKNSNKEDAEKKTQAQDVAQATDATKTQEAAQATDATKADANATDLVVKPIGDVPAGLSEDEKLEMLSQFLDTEKGIEYCAGMPDLYIETLEDYTSGEIVSKVVEFYNSEDWHNYQIQVHALKSTSRLIGSEAVGELAYEMEMAAKDENVALIKEKHDILIANFNQLSDNIKKIIK